MRGSSPVWSAHKRVLHSVSKDTDNNLPKEIGDELNHTHISTAFHIEIASALNMIGHDHEFIISTLEELCKYKFVKNRKFKRKRVGYKISLVPYFCSLLISVCSSSQDIG